MDNSLLVIIRDIAEAVRAACDSQLTPRRRGRQPKVSSPPPEKVGRFHLPDETSTVLDGRKVKLVPHQADEVQDKSDDSEYTTVTRSDGTTFRRRKRRFFRKPAGEASTVLNPSPRASTVKKARLSRKSKKIVEPTADEGLRCDICKATNLNETAGCQGCGKVGCLKCMGSNEFCPECRKDS